MEQLAISFKCIDRLNQVKDAKVTLENNDNRCLIKNLLEFQLEINSLMTEIIKREKEAIESNQLIMSQKVCINFNYI